MKNKAIMLIVVVLMAIVVIKYNIYSDVISSKSTLDVNENTGDLYIVNSIVNSNPCVINGKSEVLYNSLFENEEISIISDDYSKEQILIRIVRTGEDKIINNVEYDDGETETYETISRCNIYYDKNGYIVDMDDDNIFIDYIYNNYAIDNNYEPLSYIEARIFDLKEKKYVENENGFNVIVCENNSLIGKKLVLNGDDKEYKYFLLDKDLNIVKELTSDEYEDLNGKEYEQYKYTDNDVKFGTKHHLWYILDDNDKVLSKGYNCELIGMANFQGNSNSPIRNKYSYKDIIFYRVNDNQITYFTLEKDIYTKNICDEYDKYGNVNTNSSLYKNYNIYGRRYSDDETFVVGENNCYAILDVKKEKAYVYSLDTYRVVATLSSIVDNSYNEEVDVKYRNKFYIDDIYLYDNYVMCKFIDKVSDSYFPYINIKSGLGCEVLNKENINIVKPKRYIRSDSKYPYQIVVDIESQSNVKVLYNTYIDMKVFENNDKYIIALQKEYTVDNESLNVYDLYDKYYKLLYANVKNILQVSDVMQFERYKKQKPIKDFNDGKLYNEYRTIINFDNDVLYECDIRIKNGVEYFARHFYDGNGYVVATYKKEVDNSVIVDHIDIFDSKKKKVVDIDNIINYDFINNTNEIILFAYTNKETYIYKLIDGTTNLLKKLDKLYAYDSSYIFANDDSSSKIVYTFINKENNLYSLFDRDFNLIGGDYRGIQFGNSYYYYLNGFKIYVCDANNNVKANLNYFNFFND